MKNLIRRSFAAFGTAAFLAVNALTPAQGFTFEETEVEQDSVIAIAQPLRTQGYEGYKLLVLEQKSDARACWSETGGDIGPVEVDPLLLNFDFTGICGRATDSNGYSVRINDTDLALTHNLSLQKFGNEVKMFGVSRTGEKILIGRTNGLTDGFLKINLEPGWRFTKRTYGDKVLGHFYLSNDNYVVAEVDEEEDDIAIDIEVPDTSDDVDVEVPDTSDDDSEVAEEPVEDDEDVIAEEPDTSDDDSEVAEEPVEDDEDVIAEVPDTSDDDSEVAEEPVEDDEDVTAEVPDTSDDESEVAEEPTEDDGEITAELPDMSDDETDNESSGLDDETWERFLMMIRKAVK